jgi:hypothetical protein
MWPILFCSLSHEASHSTMLGLFIQTACQASRFFFVIDRLSNSMMSWLVLFRRLDTTYLAKIIWVLSDEASHATKLDHKARLVLAPTKAPTKEPTARHSLQPPASKN